MKRAAATVRCSCGRENTLLMPIAACGAETVWDVRCNECGAFAWFDARADADFRSALAGAKGTATDPRAQQAETDRRFAAALPKCACGGTRRVVRELEAQPCLACGNPLGRRAMTEAPALDVPPLR